MKKKWTVLLLALVLSLSLLPTAALADTSPAPGLYFRLLEESRTEPLHENTEGLITLAGKGGYIRLDKIELAPYVDRMSMALYYYDGNTCEPVKRVRLPFGYGFDIMQISERNSAAEDHWYYLSAYDFAKSELYYYTGENYAALNATPTDSIPLDSHQLPETAFYANDTGKPSEAAYRMYAVMDWTPADDENHETYKYKATLYLRSTNAEFTFGEVDNFKAGDLTYECFQKQYDDRGYEDEAQSYDGFKTESNLSADGKSLTVTVYANDTDLLLWLYGPNNQYVAYVNLLAPENTQLHLNDQGFEAAKYLPHHLFQQLKDKNLPVTLSAGDYAADITCNETLTADIADKDTAALTVETVPEDDVMGAVSQKNSDADFVGAVDITLTCDGDAQHEFTEGGSATVSYPCDLDLANGATVQVYYVADDGTTELMDATYDAENGCVTFTTTHFSTFVIVTVPKNTSGDSGTSSNDDSEPSYSINLDADGIRSDRRTAEEGELVTLTVKEGCGITDILVTDRNGNAVKVTCKDGKYTFRMPKGKITVTAVYASETPAFADVDADYWALSAIRWAAEQGYMTGLTADTFAPEGVVSRQQVWMILARLTGANPADMAAARRWAMDNGISDGSAPGAAVTRQQLVTLLYRYAVRMGYDVSVGEDTNILSYSDAFDMADYAVAAFQWACGAGVIGGTTPDTLSPLGGATRGQLAVILSRFCGVKL